LSKRGYKNMDRSKKVYAAKCAVILSAIPALILAHSGGPDPRKTGAPGDSTCAESSCHIGTAVNGGGGKIEVSFDSGTTYTPGTKVRVTVKVTDSAARIYGFQASARPSSNTRSAQAGTFTPGAEQFVLCEDGSIRNATGCRSTAPLEFVEHNNPNSTGIFQFDWTPPTTAVGDVMFYVAGNAANGNGLADRGDHIYTTTATLTAAAVSTGPKPVVSDGGVADSFNFRAGTAPSTWTAIFGTNLSGTTRLWGDADFIQGKLPTKLDGVSVTINGKPAYVNFISPGQINVLAPADTATGNVPVVVTTSNGVSAAVTVSKSNVLPAIYAPFAQDGKLFVTAVSTDPANPSLLGKVGVDPRVTRGVKPGEIILLYGTGFGETSPATPPDSLVTTASSLPTPPVIRFGDVQAEVQFAGQTGSGLYQFNLKVPDVPDGDVPLVAQISGASSASNVLITVKR